MLEGTAEGAGSKTEVEELTFINQSLQENITYMANELEKEKKAHDNTKARLTSELAGKHRELEETNIKANQKDREMDQVRDEAQKKKRLAQEQAQLEIDNAK